MNLHQIQIRSNWAQPHVTRHPNHCSECDATVRNPGEHLVREHGLTHPTWFCECTDRAAHMYEMCETIMGSEDANIDTVNNEPYGGNVLDWTFPYIYVCPDCRTHNHGRRERTR